MVAGQLRTIATCAPPGCGQDITGTVTVSGYGVRRMSETAWAQQPVPATTTSATVFWRAAPVSLTELTVLRRQLRAQLDVHPPSSAGAEDAAEWLLLAFEELASNGLRHGRGPVQVVVFATGRGWLLDVTDTAPERPPTPAVDRDPATGGLGLHMVARLGATHGWTVDGRCKHVWVRIDATPHESDVPVQLLPRPRSSSDQPSHSD